jgi:hypothetical protein
MICLVYTHVSNINTCNKDITNVGVVLNFYEELSILVVKGENAFSEHYCLKESNAKGTSSTFLYFK